MVSVNVSDYANLDEALRKFRAKVRKAHIFDMLNRKSYYLSPSERRHRRRYRKNRINSY